MMAGCDRAGRAEILVRHNFDRQFLPPDVYFHRIARLHHSPLLKPLHEGGAHITIELKKPR